MTKSAGRGRGSAEIDPRKIAAFLRSRHPVKTAAAVAAATGDPMKTVERWLADVPTMPSGGAMLRLIGAYGPAFLAACLSDLGPGLGWVARAAAFASYEGMERELAQLTAQRDELGRALWGERS